MGLGDLAPARVVAIEFAKDAVVGGTGVVAVVKLDGLAGPNGAVVSLKSLDSILKVPASVTVADQTSSISFNATTIPVAEDTTVKVRATLGSTSVTDTLVVKAPTLRKVLVSPSAGKSKRKITVLVDLTSVAGGSGIKVNLTTSNSTVVPVPSTLKVLAGATRGEISCVCGVVTEPTLITITAKLGTETKTVQVIVNP